MPFNRPNVSNKQTEISQTSLFKAKKCDYYSIDESNVNPDFLGWIVLASCQSVRIPPKKPLIIQTRDLPVTS